MRNPTLVGLLAFLAVMFLLAAGAWARQCMTIDTIHPDGRTFTQCTICSDDSGRNCTRTCI